MNYRTGQIVELVVPYSDGDGKKHRPVVIISEADSLGDLIALPITGSGHHPHTLALIDADLVSGSMKKASFIRVRKFLTCHKSVVGRSFGQLSDDAISRLMAAMCLATGCHV